MPNGFNVQQPLAVSEVDGTYELIKEPTEAIKQNLRFLILTAPGERVRVPNFGVGIRNYLFENFTPVLLSTIREKILEQASIFMPYITITSVEFNSDNVDSNQLGVAINYRSNSSTAFTDFLILEVTI